MAERGRISPEQIDDLKRRTDLRVIAGQFTQLRGTSREQYGSCPICGGRDRFHVQPHMFFCRSCCPPEGSKGRRDALDFVRFIGLAGNFREAFLVLESLVNTIPSSVRHLSEPIKRLPPDDWQTQAQREVARCQQRLHSQAGEVGQAYLSRRQIKRATWNVVSLGLAWHRDAAGRAGWAIALPWIEEDRIAAIQYRFIAPDAQRYTRFGYQGYYGETCLYRLPAKHVDTLVIVEGEFNALSIWQEDRQLDVVSFGSENMTSKTVTAIQAAVQRYERVMVWTDKTTVAEHLISAIGKPAEVISSGHDANDCCREELHNILA
jgi:hypothetical protein